MAQINLDPRAWPGQVSSFVKPWLMLAGVVLAAGLAIDAFLLPLPYVGGGQDRMLLAALLVYAGR